MDKEEAREMLQREELVTAIDNAEFKVSKEDLERLVSLHNSQIFFYENNGTTYARLENNKLLHWHYWWRQREDGLFYRIGNLDIKKSN